MKHVTFHFILFFCFVFANVSVFSQNTATLRTICELPNSDAESSGLYIQSRDSIWSVNDGGNPSEIHLIDTFGQKFREIDIVGASNLDWEELARDDAGNLYIGDFGNNLQTRQDLRVLRLVNPEAAQSATAFAEIINFSYEDQTEFPPNFNQWYFDCEAMLLMGDSIFVFTKDFSIPYIGFTRVYWLPNTPGNHIAKYFGAFYTADGSIPNGSVTGATISPDRSKIILVSNQRLWLFRNFEGQNFLNGEVHQFDLPDDTQKEAVAFVDECHVYITDERDANNIGGRLYEWDVCTWLETNTNQIATATALVTSFPQPSFGDVTLRYRLPNHITTGMLLIYNPLGQLVSKIALGTPEGDVYLNTQTLPNVGLYHFRVSSNTGQQLATGSLQRL